MTEFTRSGKNTPCPVCERTSDQDCRTKEQENLVFCHTHTADPKQIINGYKFHSATKDGLWGIFLNDKRDDRDNLVGRKIRVGEERAEFFYPNRDGTNLIKVEKVKQGSQKQFYQSHWDGKTWAHGVPDVIKSKIPIYRYNDVQQAIAAGKPIIVVEGETSADALWNMGLAATTFLGGSKKLHSFGKGYKADLAKANLILCPDRDQMGLEHMDEVQKLFPSARLLKVYPKSPIWACVPHHGGLDIEDWISEGVTAEAILEAVESPSSSNSKPKKSASELREKVKAVEAELDLFQRTLLEQEVGAEYGVRGKTLDRLVEALNPVVPSPVMFLSDSFVSIYEQIETQSKSSTIPGYCTGFHSLDAITQGFQPSDLIIVAARPSMGKSSLSLCLALNIAKQYQKPCLFFSLEMSASQLNYRLLSMESGISSQRLRTGRISSNEWEQLSHATAKLVAVPLGIDDNVTLTIEDIRQKVKDVVQEKGEIAVIVIDYIQLMKCPGYSENRNAEISKISRCLKALAREFNAPVIALSQLSRANEARSDKRPIMSDLRESGAIEQDADMIMMLYRDDYYNKSSAQNGMTELSILKHRNGPTGTVQLLFNPETTKFENYNAPISIGGYGKIA